MEIRRIWFLGLVQLGVLIPKGLNLGTEANRLLAWAYVDIKGGYDNTRMKGSTSKLTDILF
ncbi:hypothetical protein G4B88_025770 [Cannabis sativa]|uniref:Uncharacterized protein n=1 Tax=Cannabis sativa TaxID=3483 RepID=A0A7J6DN83_CANSA|nr:hypothetical protein G4B88_025770 [Cannabis sativa]